MFLGEVSKNTFGDKRLWDRYIKIGMGIGQRMSSVISNCFRTKADKNGGYRFFSNEKVTAERILDSHKDVVKKRIENTEVVLSINDTCTLSYPTHACTQNLGRVGTHKHPGRGLNTHTSLLINATTNTPIGIGHQTYFFHDEEEKDDDRPIEEKESYRWIEHLKKTHEIAPHAIHIGDRESDIYEYFQEAESLNTQVIVRANQNRIVLDRKTHEREGKISDIINKRKLCGRYFAVIEDEEVELQVKYREIILAAPKRSKKQKENRSYKPIVLTMVYVYGTTKAGKEISWTLLTNIPVSDFASAMKIVSYYMQRWNIELFHKALKSGFGLEDAQLEDGKKIEKLVALVSIEAARVYAMLYAVRLENPPPPAEFLQEDEIEFITKLMLAEGKIKTKLQKPNLKVIVEFIAEQGGFIKTKKYPYPGILTFFRGWCIIQHQIRAFRLVWNR